jgi:general secretion pathway protein D
MKKRAISLLLVSALATSSLLAKEDTFRKTNRDEVNINFKDLKIVDFIKMVAKISGKNILIAQNITGTVDYVSVKPIKKSEIFTLLTDILSTKGYTLRDTKSGFLKVIKSADASKSSPPMYGESSIGEVQTTVIPIKNLNVRTILRQINFLLSRYGKISLSNENNAIVVTDYPSNIRTIQNVINQLDKDDTNKVQFVTLHNAQAKSIYSKVKQLSNALFDNKIATQKVSVFADDAGNSIIIVGNRDNVRELIPYIRKMDKADDTVDKRMEILYVKNADATEIVKTLEKLLSDKSFAKSQAPDAKAKTVTTKIPQKSKTGKILPPIVKTETVAPSIIGDKDKPTVTVDAELNAIIVYATENELKEIRQVVNSLDTERQQVYVVAKIVEIKDDEARELGAKYEILGGIAGGAGLYGISGKLGGVLDPLTSASGLLGDSVKLPDTLSKALAMGVTISLFDQNGAAKILSEPSILCINNKESSIYVGQTESILTQQSIASSTVSLPTQNFSREDIGLTLKVKPRISADDKVSLEVSVISEDIVPGGSAGQPTTTKREVTTSSIVMNGETVIIGGLSKDKVSDELIKIPLLGDIPILGIPFRHTSTKHNKTSLVIMLTPYIVKRSEDLAALRDALGKLSVLEHQIADTFEEKYLLNGAQESVAMEKRDIAPVTEEEIRAGRVEIQIDDFGNTFEVHLDSRGNEVSRRQVPAGYTGE